ncbi:hypothetical protein V3C99_008140 [Haemonchus contortus]|nr:unnamed protein product [Haemonchus contortus]
MHSVIPRQNCGPGVVAGLKWKAWSETIVTARSAGMEELAQVIGTFANKSLAPATIAAYSSMRKRFEDFASTLSVDRSHLGNLRNLFLAHLINESYDDLNFFYGRLEGGEAKLQKLLIDSAKKETPVVVHERKASEEDIDKVVDWALNTDTIKATEDCCIILLLFAAFLRINEAAAVRKEHLESKEDGPWVASYTEV